MAIEVVVVVIVVVVLVVVLRRGRRMEAFVDEKMNLLDKGKMKEIQADFHGSMEEEEGEVEEEDE